MRSVRYFWLIPLLLGLLGLSVTRAQEPKASGTRTDAKPEPLTKTFEDTHDQTLLRKITERTYVHEAARVSFTMPEGWKEIGPHRLARRIDPRISTVLGIESAGRDMVASLYWIPMNPGQKLSEWVRAEPVGGEYGEEYETLKAVYGSDQVTRPFTFKHEKFDVYRINITGGPDRGEKYNGTLFVFAVESGGTTWLLKARVSYPRGDRGQSDQYAMEVLNGYDQMPAKTPPESKKPPESDTVTPRKVD